MHGSTYKKGECGKVMSFLNIRSEGRNPIAHPTEKIIKY